MGGWIPSDRQQANRYTAEVAAKLRAEFKREQAQWEALKARLDTLESAVRLLAAKQGLHVALDSSE